jgi:hypothetical protein
MELIKECRNCIHLNRSIRTDVGGNLIAKCRHPEGTHIGDIPINNDWVEADSVCSKHKADKHG